MIYSLTQPGKNMTESPIASTPIAVNNTPRTQVRLDNAWANASREITRYNELYDFYLNKYSENKNNHEIDDETRDWAQVHSWLVLFAETGRLFVKRNSRRGRWNHFVSILDYDGNVIAETCGFITGVDVAQEYVRWTEKVGDDNSLIRLMISSTHFPDIAEFQRADGSSVNLGWNEDYFHCFDVILHNDAIEDNFDDINP